MGVDGEIHMPHFSCFVKFPHRLRESALGNGTYSLHVKLLEGAIAQGLCLYP